MNNKINICYATDKTIGLLHTNSEFIVSKINENLYNSSWLDEVLGQPAFVELKHKIEDFELKLDSNNKYENVLCQNAITLYETLKELPRYILTDERFWTWITMRKCYRASIQAMPLNRKTTFDGQWIFTRGNVRGIWFNVHARSYFWVECTVNYDLPDEYEYTKFVFDKIDRIRHLTFDTNKPQNIIYNTVRAEKALFDKYANNNEYAESFKKCESGIGGNTIYSKIRREISLYGSVRLLSVMSDDDIFNTVYNKIENILLEVHKGNIDILK